MPNLDYANYDFNEIVAQIQDRLALKGSWSDTYRSGTGQMLIEFHAYVLNQLMWYVERAAQESYLPTARNRSSIINLVRLLGYQPKRAVSATGHVTFSIPLPATKRIFIPKFTVVATSAGVRYYVTQDMTLEIGHTSVAVPIKQGERNESQISSDGALKQSYSIQHTDVENSGLEVIVDGVTWTQVSSFVLGDPTSRWYKVLVNMDDTLTVVFGDNITSKAPSAGSEILLRWFRSVGSAGNVYVSGAINSLLTTVFDESGARVSDISVSNSDAVMGGDEAESAEEIRDEAPRVFATGDRAVTKDDYIAILDNYPSVASSNVWGENEENPPNYDMFNRVKMCLVLQDWKVGSDLSYAFKQELSDYLYTKAQLTVKYTFVDATIIYVVPTLVVRATKGYSLEKLSSDINDAYVADYVLGDTTKLGVSKRIGDAYQIVENIEGVSHAYVTLKVRKDLTPAFDSAYAYGGVVDVLPIAAGSVKILLNDVLVAEDDGTGNLVSHASDPAVSGTVIYVTGGVFVDISPLPAPTDVVSVVYEQDAGGDVVLGKNQICKLHSVDMVELTY